MKMKVVVTGATGFIGAALVLELLKRGASVFALGRDSQKLKELSEKAAELPGSLYLWEQDITLLKGFPKEADVVIHAAALRDPFCNVNPAQAIKVNVGGTVRLLTLAQENGVQRFIFLSTQAVYGDTPPPWREDGELAPRSVYALSKYAAEEALWASRRTTAIAVLRLSRVYGVGLFMPWNELIGRFVSQAICGGYLEVHGDGTQRLDLVHVRDVVQCVLRLLTSERGWDTTINVGGGASVSVKEIAEITLRIAYRRGFCKSRLIMRPDVQPRGYRHLELDISRARELLGWVPRVNLEEGIDEYFRGDEYGKQACSNVSS